MLIERAMALKYPVYALELAIYDTYIKDYISHKHYLFTDADRDGLELNTLSLLSIVKDCQDVTQIISLKDYNNLTQHIPLTIVENNLLDLYKKVNPSTLLKSIDFTVFEIGMNEEQGTPSFTHNLHNIYMSGKLDKKLIELMHFLDIQESCRVNALRLINIYESSLTPMSTDIRKTFSLTASVVSDNIPDKLQSLDVMLKDFKQGHYTNYLKGEIQNENE